MSRVAGCPAWVSCALTAWNGCRISTTVIFAALYAKMQLRPPKKAEKSLQEKGSGLHERKGSGFPREASTTVLVSSGKEQASLEIRSAPYQHLGET